ncbi:MAG: crotonase/enoyl-CoA hydratase family protein [Acidimicrobiia bacterium]|nr:crotonase/enoyl-CoA hydratase family protein [Acidimicrobiia bacterium]
MADPLVLTEDRGMVRVITLNRPDAMNSINLALSEALADAMDALDADDGIRVGVLTGAGRGFSAGMDLKAFVAGEMPMIEGRGLAGMVERGPRKPLIAAVEGFALAGGLEVVLGCDLVVAAVNAKLGIPEVTVGLFAGAGALGRLQRHLPESMAMKMALTGEPITGEEAHRHGLVVEITERGGAVDAAVALGERIAKNAPLGVAASKRIIRESWGLTDAEYWPFQNPIMSDVFATEDATEGATAFAEKREPNWRGR